MSSGKVCSKFLAGSVDGILSTGATFGSEVGISVAVTGGGTSCATFGKRKTPPKLTTPTYAATANNCAFQTLHGIKSFVRVELDALREHGRQKPAIIFGDETGRADNAGIGKSAGLFQSSGGLFVQRLRNSR